MDEISLEHAQISLTLVDTRSGHHPDITLRIARCTGAYADIAGSYSMGERDLLIHSALEMYRLH